jgi:cytochrome P450
MPLPNVLKTPPLLKKLQWILDPVHFMESAAQQYPDLFTAQIVGFGDTFVFVQHPEAICDPTDPTADVCNVHSGC